MSKNFAFLENLPDFSGLRELCEKAEDYVVSTPVYSAICARQAAEYLVKFLYGAYVGKFENCSLYEILSNPEFMDFLNDYEIVAAIHRVRKIGNTAAHEGKIADGKAMEALRNLYFAVNSILKKLSVIKECASFNEEICENHEIVLWKEHDQYREPIVEKKVMERFSGVLKNAEGFRDLFLEQQARNFVNIHKESRMDAVNRVSSGTNSRAATAYITQMIRNLFPNLWALEEVQHCTIQIKKQSGKSMTIAVRTACSVLGKIDKEGKENILPGIDIVLYAIDLLPDTEIEKQFHAFTKDEFMLMWKECNLVRHKTTKAAADKYRKIYGEDKIIPVAIGADTIAVQTFAKYPNKLRMVEERVAEKPQLSIEYLEKLLKEFL